METYSITDPLYGTNPQEQVPNSTAVLVLGICSIVFCCCCSFLGIPLAIIALVMGNTAKGIYAQNPSKYTIASFKNLNAGFICAIIGLVMNIVSLILSIVNLIVNPNSTRELQRILENM